MKAKSKAKKTEQKGKRVLAPARPTIVEKKRHDAERERIEKEKADRERAAQAAIKRAEADRVRLAALRDARAKVARVKAEAPKPVAVKPEAPKPVEVVDPTPEGSVVLWRCVWCGAENAADVHACSRCGQSR
jgi:hypothetical protein